MIGSLDKSERKKNQDERRVPQFSSFLSVVEAFAYNGTGDETALKRLGALAAGVSTCALFRFLFLSICCFLFCLASFAFKHRLEASPSIFLDSLFSWSVHGHGQERRG